MQSQRSKASYRAHKYSGPKRGRKASRAQLKRFHGDTNTTHEDLWRKKTKPNEPIENEPLPSTSSDLSSSQIKTYARKQRQILVEADYSQNTPPPQQTKPEKVEDVNVNWPILDPTLDSHQLTVEIVQRDNLQNLSGYRIVNIQHVLYWAFELENHRKNCPSSTIEFVKETRSGFSSIFNFKCTMCDKEFRKSSETEPNVNKAFVWGTVTSGSYYTQASHITNLMDIPTMSPNMFRDIENSLGDDMKKNATTVWAFINAANENVISKTNRLSNETTNVCENLMSIVSKLISGKRVNLHKRGSYQRRVHVAGLSKMTGHRWHTSAWRRCTTRSPGLTMKKYIQQLTKSQERQKTYTRRRLFTPKAKPDQHYGPKADDPEEPINKNELEKACDEKLKDFDKTLDEIKDLEMATIGQHENDLYNTLRCDRLTASHFGVVCKRRTKTPCHNHVKQILYKSDISSKDMMYGQQNESVARTIFAENYNKSVRPSGLFIDEEYGFLGASPDGVVINEEAILEIKCFPSLARLDMNVERAAQEKKYFPLVLKDGKLEMNKNHNYYYQVQGQLRVTNMKKCYFVCYISPEQPIKVIEIERDEDFIAGMVPKLVAFFKKCVLPEIILRRVKKYAKCLDL